jgi:hypothetical protein
MNTEEIAAPLVAAIDRRIGTRKPLNLRIQLNLFFANESQTQVQLDGVSRNLSPRGMRIAVPNFSQALYRRVLSGVRLVELFLELPDLDTPIRMHGKVIWMDFHTTGVGVKDGTCYLGLDLDPIGPDADAAYQRLLEDVV